MTKTLDTYVRKMGGIDLWELSVVLSDSDTKGTTREVSIYESKEDAVAAAKAAVEGGES